MAGNRGIPSIEARRGREALQLALGDVGLTMRVRVERDGEWMEPGSRLRFHLPVHVSPMKAVDAVAAVLVAVHHPVGVQIYGPSGKLLVSRVTAMGRKVCPKSPCDICSWGGMTYRKMFT